MTFSFSGVGVLAAVFLAPPSRDLGYGVVGGGGGAGGLSASKGSGTEAGVEFVFELFRVLFNVRKWPSMEL